MLELILGFLISGIIVPFILLFLFTTDVPPCFYTFINSYGVFYINSLIKMEINKSRFAKFFEGVNNLSNFRLKYHHQHDETHRENKLHISYKV